LAKIWTLRQQISVLRQTAPKRLSFSVIDCLVFVGLYQLFPEICCDHAKGIWRATEHLTRHPFGKVPVLDHDGLRLIETAAIARYLNDVLPGKSLIPSNPRDRARMDMIVGLVDAYGYGALAGGVAAHHLFPDFVGGKNEAIRKNGIETGRKLMDFAMKTRGDSEFIAGELSLADLFLAPVVFYVSLTPDKDAALGVDGFADWWARVQALPSFKNTQPVLG
jgi:glutathione S-transferase